VPATVFPASAGYVALGHLHRSQRIAAPAPTWYPGSPLQLDFGEEADTKSVLVVELAAGAPAVIDAVPLRAGHRLRTLAGTLAELAVLAAQAQPADQAELAGEAAPADHADQADDDGEAAPADQADQADDDGEAAPADQADQADDDGERAGADGVWLRVVVTERSRPGLAEEVRALFPDVVDVRVAPPDDSGDGLPGDGERPSRLGRTPAQLFGDYLAERRVDDPRLPALFGELLEQASVEERSEGADAA
jgi:hypothetical protein